MSAGPVNLPTRRVAEEDSRSLLSAIINSSDDAIISKDLSGVITSWNKSAERLFGYTAQEAIGQTIAALLIPEDRQNEEPAILARLRRGERVDHFETVRRRKDGTLLDISLTISPVRNAQGVTVGASKIARDITESKRIRSALVESEARFRQLADAMPQMVWTARPDGYIDYYNERWYHFTGVSREVFGEPSWTPIVHPQDLERTKTAFYAAINGGKPYSGEYRLWDRSNERWSWFIGRALPAYNRAGEITKWFGTCTDIDQQKRVENDLRCANDSLEQFAFSASHDLQEPLRSIKIFSELLTRRHADKLDGQALEYLRHLHHGAARIEALVCDLLAYTEASQGGHSAQRTDANEALHKALAGLRTELTKSAAEITFSRLPAVAMSGNHLRQLFHQLLDNALKYQAPGRTPKIDITAEQQHDEWVFAVRDNGIGVEPNYREHIFGLFKRLHTGTEYEGTGIGLAICRRILDHYRGSIWVESEPGQGATFRFTVPA